jgi:hypothetical protein
MNPDGSGQVIEEEDYFFWREGKSVISGQLAVDGKKSF